MKTYTDILKELKQIAKKYNLETYTNRYKIEKEHFFSFFIDYNSRTLLALTLCCTKHKKHFQFDECCIVVKNANNERVMIELSEIQFQRINFDKFFKGHFQYLKYLQIKKEKQKLDEEFEI